MHFFKDFPQLMNQKIPNYTFEALICYLTSAKSVTFAWRKTFLSTKITRTLRHDMQSSNTAVLMKCIRLAKPIYVHSLCVRTFLI